VTPPAVSRTDALEPALKNLRGKLLERGIEALVVDMAYSFVQLVPNKRVALFLGMVG
jgi:hypothetical protein